MSWKGWIGCTGQVSPEVPARSRRPPPKSLASGTVREYQETGVIAKAPGPLTASCSGLSTCTVLLAFSPAT